MSDPNMKDIYYSIIQRYYNRFCYRKRNDKSKRIAPNKEDIQILRVYSGNTIFSSNKNIVKEMINIHYQIQNDDIVHLSIDLEFYTDLLVL
jgi:hypothetical protein